MKEEVSGMRVLFPGKASPFPSYLHFPGYSIELEENRTDGSRLDLLGSLERSPDPAAIDSLLAGMTRRRAFQVHGTVLESLHGFVSVVIFYIVFPGSFSLLLLMPFAFQICLSCCGRLSVRNRGGIVGAVHGTDETRYPFPRFEGPHVAKE